MVTGTRSSDSSICMPMCFFFLLQITECMFVALSPKVLGAILAEVLSFSSAALFFFDGSLRALSGIVCCVAVWRKHRIKVLNCKANNIHMHIV
jgi:hypothetical protein